jgi:uncharacterized protein
LNTVSVESGERVGPIASYWHSLTFLLIMALVVANGMRLQQRSTAGPGIASEHKGVVVIYLIAAAADWLLFYFVWVGVHRRGGTVRNLIGRRWNSARDFFTDLAILVPFFAIWEGTAYAVHQLLGPNTARSVDILLPRSVLEVSVWIFVCITAGITEEAVFRGYVQRQLLGLTNSIVIAVVGQGIVFGLAHAYQGWKNVIVISVLGVLYGMLAAWRRSTAPGMIVHAFTDVWEGWLKFMVWR